ncbi:MAG TPA: SHOCT domain-containing protein [Steroidobacteraceae bacterium]|nr:SHOCT domain-containing protein [Steroidobacteraceae bacterium]
MDATEHILLESGEREVPARETARRIHARVSLRDTRRRTVELALIEYYYLSVRIMHRGSVVARYVVDLRFVDPAPRRERQLGWPWLAAGALFMSLAIAGAHAIASGRAPWWHHEWLPATAALFGLGGCAMFAGFQLSRETLALVSAHGRARLLAHAGHLGTFRALRTFLPRLAAHLDVAFRARRSSRAKQLRDEMREHFRLREAGAISEAEYESAKRRILATHMSSAVRTRVRHAPNKKARESPPGPFDRT